MPRQIHIRRGIKFLKQVNFQKISAITTLDIKSADNRAMAFDLLEKIPGMKRGPGGVICLYDKLITLKGNDRVIPVNYL